jgi:DNA modification methylase
MPRRKSPDGAIRDSTAERIEWRPIDWVKPDPRNSRRHPDEQLAALRGSFREFGWVWPCLVKADGTLIAGEGRWRAARLEGATQAKVLLASNMSERQVRAFVIADNQLPLGAEWDQDRLRQELNELLAEGFGMASLGFSEEELARQMMEQSSAKDPDAPAPAPPANPVSRAGDVWLLGPHRVRCGDATAEADVAALLGGVGPVLMVTDPPYGVNYDPAWRMRANVNKNTRKMGQVINDDRADWTPAWKLYGGPTAYVWHGALHAGEVEDSLIAAGFTIRTQIIWVKDRFVLGRGNYHWQHEPCFHAVRGKSKWMGGRDQSTTWSIAAREDSGHGHGTQKPVECMARPIRNNSGFGQAVYDPFLGSGTTVIAAQLEGRVCFGMDISPGYVDVAVQRWQDFTGKAATLQGDGRIFEAVTAGER